MVHLSGEPLAFFALDLCQTHITKVRQEIDSCKKLPFGAC
ncbi:hypothetical protein IMCC12053_2692 [Celeribacter marinus]|uniref:Uncharacterized protein n=1 Tax=Celeribacter marinus TaxID=1397108 RepID=A0A0N9ZS22_9RHOB|nr:hypothetical protein IMCC12053_2692 [Celeribacter marinus]